MDETFPAGQQHIEQAQPDLPQMPHSEKVPDQPSLTEQAYTVDIEAKIAEITDLHDRIRRIVSSGHAGNADSPEGTFIPDHENEEHPIMRIVHDSSEGGVRNESMIFVDNGEITFARTVTTPAGRRILDVKVTESGNQGRLERRGTDDRQLGPPATLNESHIRDIVENVLGQLQKAAEAKELDASNELDKEVAEILGVEPAAN